MSLAPALLLSMPQLIDPELRANPSCCCASTRRKARSASSSIGRRTSRPPKPCGSSRRSTTRTICRCSSAGPSSRSAAGSSPRSRPSDVEHRSVGAGLYLSASPVLLRRVLMARPLPRRTLVLAGYAGWGPGQLDERARRVGLAHHARRARFDLRDPVDRRVGDGDSPPRRRPASPADGAWRALSPPTGTASARPSSMAGVSTRTRTWRPPRARRLVARRAERRCERHARRSSDCARLRVCRRAARRLAGRRRRRAARRLPSGRGARLRHPRFRRRHARDGPGVCPRHCAARGRGRRAAVHDGRPARDGAEAIPSPVAAGRRALIVYTSGTTGRPKGVVTTHANIAAQVAALTSAWAWTASDRTLLVLPLHHVHGIINVRRLRAGRRAPAARCLPRFDAGATWARLASGEITVFTAVPTIYHRLIAAWEARARRAAPRWSAGAGARG